MGSFCLPRVHALKTYITHRGLTLPQVAVSHRARLAHLLALVDGGDNKENDTLIGFQPGGPANWDLGVISATAGAKCSVHYSYGYGFAQKKLRFQAGDFVPRVVKRYCTSPAVRATLLTSASKIVRYVKK